MQINSLPSDLPEHVGFKNGTSGIHSSRTIMYEELRLLFNSTPEWFNQDQYYRSILEGNILLKNTISTRRTTATKLQALYIFNPNIIIFWVLRYLWQMEEEGRPILAFLCAHARDPLLRITSMAVLPVPVGEHVKNERIEQVVAEATSNRFYEKTLHSIGRNAASSWTQSGHLIGKNKKVRIRAKATPASTAYALLLAHLSGIRGALLFDNYWTQLLDSSQIELENLAFEASRKAWLDYRKMGNVTEIGFAHLLSQFNKEANNGKD